MLSRFAFVLFLTIPFASASAHQIRHVGQRHFHKMMVMVNGQMAPIMVMINGEMYPVMVLDESANGS